MSSIELTDSRNLQWSITMSLVALGAALLAPALAIGADAPPNVLVILSDDQGWGDVEYNCENSTGMCAHTPNLRRLATSEGSVYFHRFYSAAGVCSPTRAAILSGRTNERDCIHSALPCDQEDPAPTCAQGRAGAFPTSEFTIANAAKASPLGDYETIQIGKWHLGDLWDKKIPNMNKKWPVSSPGLIGFDRWISTQAEASSSMSNCGCFPVNHTKPGPKPPSGYDKITPNGDQCVVGGGFFSDWCYPCTDYFYPNNSDPRGVSGLSESYKVPGDDSKFIMDTFEEFLDDVAVKQKRPFLAHLCLHSIHEPHPSMPQYWDMYKTDPDYLGTLTQMDVQIGRALDMLDSRGLSDNTVIFYTTDNGPHQGDERSDIHWSTGNMLRQCKASIFEGGIRVPGIMRWPQALKGKYRNITTPVATYDILPTVMDILNVTSSINEDWVVDGRSLVPVVTGSDPNAPRKDPLVFSWGGQQAIIDNQWKLMTKPEVGQCDQQPGFDFSAPKDELFLFNLADDVHELNDLKKTETKQYNRLVGLLNNLRASIAHSQYNETHCAD